MTAEPFHSTTDKGLAKQNQQQQQFLSLFLRSEREIYRYVAALVPNLGDAEEIVQQTAVSLWEKFSEYDPKLPFTPWACRFALNKTRQWIERHQRWKSLLQDGLAERLLNRREELAASLDQRLQYLEGCIAKLPQEQRQLIEDYYYAHTPVDQLCKTTGRTEAATYKMLQRVRKSLQSCIEKEVDVEGIAP